ncbi:hypothetical protein F0L68_40895, partial [Solihabitans fulvus]
AEQMGIPIGTVKGALHRARKRGELPAPVRRGGTDIEQVVSLRSQGLSYREIAEQMGIPIGTVGYSLHVARTSAAADPD